MRTDLALVLVCSAILALAIALLQVHWALFVPVFVFGTTCIAAALILDDPARARRVTSALEVDRYVPLYHGWMMRTLNVVMGWVGQSPKNDDDRTLWRILRDCFTYRLLDRAMLLAVVYPVLLLVLFWGLSGAPGRLGAVELIPAADPYWLGPASLGVIAFMAGGEWYKEWASARPQRFVRKVAGGLPLLAIAIGASLLGMLTVFVAQDQSAVAAAFAFAVAVTVAFAFSIAGASALALAVGGAVAFAGAGAGAGAVGALAVAFAFALAALERRGLTTRAAAVAIGVPSAAIAATVAFLDWDSVPQAGVAIFLFLGVLPLVNALFDTVSYGVTLALAQRGLRGGALFFGVVDFVIALALFLALGGTLVALVTWMELASGADFVDLGGLLAQAGDLRTYWWLYAMLFSTALPTLVHLIIASLSLQSFAYKPWRLLICNHIEAAGEGDALAAVLAVLHLGGVWFLSAALPTVLLGLIGWGLWTSGLGTALEHYRDWLLSIAGSVGGV